MIRKFIVEGTEAKLNEAYNNAVIFEGFKGGLGEYALTILIEQERGI
jgi:hypothetical protein